MSEEVALGQVTVADLQPGDRIRIGEVEVRVVAAARTRLVEVDSPGNLTVTWDLPLTMPVELLSADQDDDDAIREALYESTAEVER